MKAISWPRGSIVASLQRKRQVLIPRGETILKASDVLAIVVDDDSLEAVQAMGKLE
jgi:CIC family chloride channel protein